MLVKVHPWPIEIAPSDKEINALVTYNLKMKILPLRKG
jgi:hypothetical protein